MKHLPVALALLALPVQAQIETAQVLGSTASELGTILPTAARSGEFLDDVDGDGVDDWVVAGSSTSHGRSFVRVLSGAGGELLFEWSDIGSSPLGRLVQPLGDVNGDGLPELAIPRERLGDPRRIEVWSTGTWTLLYTILPPSSGSAQAFGAYLGRIQDLTGDGVDELATCDVPFGTFGQGFRAWVFDGVDGSLVHEFGPELGDFGVALGSPGDLDGDGLGEVMIGAPDMPDGIEVPGAVFVYRGSDGSLLRVHDRSTLVLRNEGFGAALAFPGDVEGDGVPDYAIASRYPVPGRLRLFSGATGAVLHEWDELGDGLSTASVAAVGDLDGDGAMDLALRRGQLLPPTGDGVLTAVDLLSTRPPYSRLDVILGRQQSFGQELAGGPDLDGDGAPDLLVATPTYLDSNGSAVGEDYDPGRVVRYSLRDLAADATIACTSTINSTGWFGRIWYEGSLSVAEDDLDLVAWDVVVQNFGVFFHGPNPIQVPFGDGFRCVASPVVRLGVVLTTDAGIAWSPLPLSAPGVQPGTPLYVQYWYRDPSAGSSGFNLSDAMVLSLVP